MDDIKSIDKNFSDGSRENYEIPDFKETAFCLLTGGTRIGGRKENQDSYGYSETKHGLLIVVCDGMGGAKGGKTASLLAVDIIMNEVENSELVDKAEILSKAIEKANEVVNNTSRARQDLAGMGTTVVALLIDDEKATVAHVGDSRIYQIRGRRKVFRTFDHSMVFELVKRGTISEEQARLSAESNVILRAVGIKPTIEVETNSNLPYLKGDRFLLCSDGICGAVAENELIKLISASKNIKDTTETLVKTIDQTGINSGGKHDNLTAALIQMNINSILKPKMDKKSKIVIGIVSFLLIISIALNFSQSYYSKINLNKELKKADSLSIDNTKMKENAEKQNKALEDAKAEIEKQREQLISIKVQEKKDQKKP